MIKADRMVNKIRKAYRKGKPLPSFSDYELNKIYAIYDFDNGKKAWTVGHELKLHKKWKTKGWGYNPRFASVWVRDLVKHLLIKLD